MNHILTGVTLALLLMQSAHSKKIGLPELSAKSYIVAEADGTILKEQNGITVRPIASISKLIMAMIATTQPSEELLDIPVRRTMRTSIPTKTTRMSRQELLTLSLVRSDNFATMILCSYVPNCIIRMNEEARRLGMVDTHFEDPTGLNDGNVSTARDLLKLLIVASANPTISSLSRMPNAEILIDKFILKIRNTNPLTSKLDVVLSKTGTTNAAGGCLVMVLNSTVGERILILLGSRNGKTRITDMEKLIKDL